jgi:hypothetical protein
VQRAALCARFARDALLSKLDAPVRSLALMSGPLLRMLALSVK